jgi:hypothetical protein
MDLTLTTGIDGRWGECIWTARDLVAETAPAHERDGCVAGPEPQPAAATARALLVEEGERHLPIFRWLLAAQRA